MKRGDRPTGGRGRTSAPGRVTGRLRLLIASPSVQTTAAGVALLALATGTSILVVRVLGVEGRGASAAAMLWPALLTYVGSLGLAPAILYFSAERRLGRAPVLQAALRLSVLQAAVVGALGFVLLPVVLIGQPERVVTLSRLALVALPVSIALLFISASLQSAGRLRTYNVVRVAIPLATLGTYSALAVWEHLSVAAVVAVPIAFSVVALVVVGLICARDGLLKAPRPPRSTYREMVQFGTRAYAGDLATIANARLDQLLLAAFAAPEALGTYLIALSFSQGITVLSTSLQIVIQPRVANSSTTIEQRTSLERGLRTYLLAGLPLLAVLALLAPVAIPFVFGREQAVLDAVPIAVVLLLATFFLGIKHVCAGGLQAAGHPWLVSRTELLGSAVTVLGLSLFLRPFGLIAAAVTSLVAYALQAVILTVSLRGYGLLRFRHCVYGPGNRSTF